MMDDGRYMAWIGPVVEAEGRRAGGGYTEGTYSPDEAGLSSSPAGKVARPADHRLPRGPGDRDKMGGGDRSGGDWGRGSVAAAAWGT